MSRSSVISLGNLPTLCNSRNEWQWLVLLIFIVKPDSTVRVAINCVASFAIDSTISTTSEVPISSYGSVSFSLLCWHELSIRMSTSMPVSLCVHLRLQLALVPSQVHLLHLHLHLHLLHLLHMSEEQHLHVHVLQQLWLHLLLLHLLLQ